MIEPSNDKFERNFAVPLRSRGGWVPYLIILLVAVAAGSIALRGLYGGGFSWATAPNHGVSSDTEQASVGQQVVDQVQALQQDLAAQQAATQRLSDAVDALSRKFDALQQSFASTPVTVAKAISPRKKPVPAPSTRLAPFSQ
jgi:uncharacterized coiled-coil protein SlyX